MWKKVSGGLGQMEKLRRGLAPVGIDQSGLEQAGAITMIAGCAVIDPTGGGEGQPAQAAGFGDDAAGLHVGDDGLLPEDDSCPDLATENQAELAVLTAEALEPADSVDPADAAGTSVSTVSSADSVTVASISSSSTAC